MNGRTGHFWLLLIALRVGGCWSDPVAGEPLPQSPARLGRGLLCGEGSSTIAVNPDGRMIATGGDEGVLLWDREKHRRVATLDGHTDCIGAVAFSPDGRLLASGSNDRTVRLWDMETRTQRMVLRGHTGRVTAVVFSPDGRIIASGASQGGSTWEGTVRLWSAEDGRSLGVLEVGDPIYALSFSPDGRRIAAAGLNAIVHL